MTRRSSRSQPHVRVISWRPACIKDFNYPDDFACGLPCAPSIIDPLLPTSMPLSTDATAAAQAAALRAHFTRTVLPLWRGPGFDSAMQLPYEAVSAEDHAPLPVTRYRAMACARQLFVFSLAGDATHAQTLFASLCRHFRDERHGGWFYSIDAAGAPLDTT
jgi:hypothetical protein